MLLTPSRQKILRIVFILSAMLTPRPSYADAFNEFLGARSVAMGGAHRGLGTSNETLILNPAGMALGKRYSIDALYGYGKGDHINHGNLSAVDSKSSLVAAGVSYTRDWGNPSGSDASFNRVYFGLAYALSPMISTGFNVQNLRGGFSENGARHDVSLYNTTAGLSINLGQSLGLGVAYQNIIGTDTPRLMPPNLAAGASLRTSRATLTADMRFDMREKEAHHITFGTGAEVFVHQAFALRGGYRRAGTDPTFVGPLGHFITGGVAAVSQGGGLQISFEHLLVSSSFSMLAGMQFYM